MKTKITSILVLTVASVNICGFSQEPQIDGSQAKTAASTPAAADEATAWESTVKAGTKDAYLAFGRKYPKSDRIQIRTGTVRGRYWYGMVVDPQTGNFKQQGSGVLVTVEGLNVLKNVSLEEAKADKLLDIKPATKGEEINAQGQTFNWTCTEVTSGGYVAGDDRIAPKDSTGSMVVLSGDGKELLAWDVTAAKPAAQPSDKPTYLDLPANKTWLPKP